MTISGSTNSSSLVSLLKFDKTSFLFTADVKPDIQNKIIEEFPEVSNSTCVKLPHHGGKLNDKFKTALDAKFYVISVGDNEYGRPFMDKFKDLEGDLFRTDKKGDIVMESNGKVVVLKDE